MDGQEFEDRRLEIENRIRNLMWAVSGDYELSVGLDVESFQKAPEISLYDAIKQGAFAKFFDQEVFGLYLTKKIYLGADERALMGIAQLCVDGASFEKVKKERPGVPEIRNRAFEALLEENFEELNADIPGRLKIAFMRKALTGEEACEKRLREPLEKAEFLKFEADTMDVIRCVDEIYNHTIDLGFEGRCGNLDQVLAVSMAELKQFDWQDYLEEEAKEARLEDYIRRMQQGVFPFVEEEQTEKDKKGGGVLLLDEEAVTKIYSYMELNYGRSYLNEGEQRRVNRRLCRGIHEDCSLYFTDGILNGMVRHNAQYELAKKTREMNLTFLHQNERMTRQNIRTLTGILKRALQIQNEREVETSEYGAIVPQRLWNIGRTSNKKLFDLEIKKEMADFAVEILMDASGSQRDRTSQVALQGYILSESLYEAGIPHSVFGFCSFWDYTVMRRFREFDEGREANRRIFEFYASANNRDGLAIRTAGDALEKRTEEKKILIVLSDGRPNDVIVNRPNSKNPTPYFGEYAIRDTAQEIRKLRNRGISVLGVFAGAEQDLLAERKIFGKDFAYIRDLKNFSNVTGLYLKKQLSE